LSQARRKLRAIQTYSEELGLDLRKPEDRFKWFLASVLFAKRISSDIAKRTFTRFVEEGLTTPDAILKAGWDELVQVLDSGGYTRYDFSTATNLLDISSALMEKYGTLENMHERAESPRQLEEMLMQFRGVGPVAVNIVLRELRGVWGKAKPKPSKIASEVSRRLRVKAIEDFESQLVRVGLEFCKKGRCSSCPVGGLCVDRAEKARRRP